MFSSAELLAASLLLPATPIRVKVTPFPLLQVFLYFGGPLGNDASALEGFSPVVHDGNGNAHQGKALNVTVTVFEFYSPLLPGLLVVELGNALVEGFHNVFADGPFPVRCGDQDEIVASDVSDEGVRVPEPLGAVLEQTTRVQDDPVTRR